MRESSDVENEASFNSLFERGLISREEIKRRLRAFGIDGPSEPSIDARMWFSVSVAGRVQAQIEVSLSPAPPLFVEVPSSLASLAAEEETKKLILSLAAECAREGYRLGRSETPRGQGEA